MFYQECKHIVIITVVIMAALFFTNYGNDNIVGTWELVYIEGLNEYEFADFPRWVETYFSDGTGIVYMDDAVGDFRWSIDGNRLNLQADGMLDETMNFRVSGSTFITYYPERSDYPKGTWTFIRIDQSDQ